MIKAAGEGLMPTGPDGPEVLSLRMSEQLLQSLETREWGKPLALGKVIVREHELLSKQNSKPDLLTRQDEAVSLQHMIPMKKFMDNSSSIYDQHWLFRPWWPLSWGLRQLGFAESTSAAKDRRNGQYVIIRNLEVCFLTGLRLSEGGLNQTGSHKPDFIAFDKRKHPCRTVLFSWHVQKKSSASNEPRFKSDG